LTKRLDCQGIQEYSGVIYKYLKLYGLIS